jgi:DNA-directed RNA polymerase subunit omega
MAKKQRVETEAEPADPSVEGSPPVKAKVTRRTRKPPAAPVEAAEELAPPIPVPLPEPQPWPESAEDWVEDVEAAYLQSKYTLVSVAAKRARQLLNGSKRSIESLSEKPVTIALEELAQGKLYFERMRDGIK